MKSFRIFDRQAGRIITAFGLLVATVIPAFTPALAAAAQITGRSIELSSSTADAANVRYNLVFTPISSADATAVQFCSDTPLIGESCAAPSGLTVSGAAVSGATSVSTPAVAASMGPVVVIEKSITATETTLEITGIHNPTAVGSFYARIITYDSKAHAEADYTATGDLGDNDGIGGAGAGAANLVDTGSVALRTTNEIGVDAKVLESLVFCVSKGLSGTNTDSLGAAASDEIIFNRQD